jgi:hypothetical protein
MPGTERGGLAADGHIYVYREVTIDVTCGPRLLRYVVDAQVRSPARPIIVRNSARVRGSERK